MPENQYASPPSPAIYKDADGNEITTAGKWLAGLLIVLFTLSSGTYLIAHWPDRIPGPKETSTYLYTNQWFHVRLIDALPDTAAMQKTAVLPPADTAATDTVQGPAAINDPIVQATNKRRTSDGQATANRHITGPSDQVIHINTLLLMLVAVAGFLGNMIHIATSFTTFIGAGKFRRSWILWYCVKPFTAAALAIAVYFVFRGGFLNMSDDSSNINIYGLMTISLLTGLFTDRATLKLKEVFDVLFRTAPKEERPDKLENGTPETTTATTEESSAHDASSSDKV
ncbi:hypothetical protein [Chitinophaga agri]|uniref:Uncharacterized protein n=1 Tax=Chitinophaga agri TaxID=2703787 RepID=A0A6B9ZDS8_9BACT|nr:hypothetical protein [Chitinophaga agri]QHS60287.1 hypothetical protein GWR21_11940 [Chitinophaga agri]